MASWLLLCGDSNCRLLWRSEVYPTERARRIAELVTSIDNDLYFLKMAEHGEWQREHPTEATLERHGLIHAGVILAELPRTLGNVFERFGDITS